MVNCLIGFFSPHVCSLSHFENLIRCKESFGVVPSKSALVRPLISR